MNSLLSSFSLPPRYGNFFPRFAQLATVSILANLMVPLAGIFDTAFLGHLSDLRHLAGVILASILFDYLYRILKFFRNSTNALTAQALGKDDHPEILLALLRSGLVALVVALGILLLQYPIHKLGFGILSGSPALESCGLDYYNARIWGAPAVLLNFVLIGWFLGREMNGWVLAISFVANGSNVGMDYLMINQWGWASMGAGLATSLSQYLALLVALVGVAVSIEWQELPKVFPQVLAPQAFKSTVLLKGNLLLRFIALITAYSIFTNLSAVMGTELIAQNGLILQIVLLSQFTVNGIGLTTQTLIGNFQGKGQPEQMMPLLNVALLSSLMISSLFAAVSLFFPETVFGLLTSHTNVSQAAGEYTIWLLPLLTFNAAAFMLEGYVIGLKESAKLRNSALMALGLGFVPLAIMAWYFQSNHLLWLSLTSYMATLMISLGVQVPGIQSHQNRQLQAQGSKS